MQQTCRVYYFRTWTGGELHVSVLCHKAVCSKFAFPAPFLYLVRNECENRALYEPLKSTRAALPRDRNNVAITVDNLQLNAPAL